MGTRPCAPHDQRTQWAYIFGAICPEKGKAAGLVMPWCNTEVMAEHLQEISHAVDPGANAVLILDQAGWHGSAKLAIPANITLLPLPPRSPELNPVENLWQFMRDNWLSDRVFTSYDDIVVHCSEAWNKLDAVFDAGAVEDVRAEEATAVPRKGNDGSASNRIFAYQPI